MPNFPDQRTGWCEVLYQERATQLVLYGRSLGLSHCEAEDVLQETFIALMNLPEAPANPSFYCLEAFRNRARNFRRSLWRRLAREWESRGWFENLEQESGVEDAAVRALQDLPPDQREVIVLKIWHRHTCSFQALEKQTLAWTNPAPSTSTMGFILQSEAPERAF